MMRKVLIAAVIAGTAAASPFGGGAAFARPQHADARPIIRFDQGKGEREAHVANVPRFTRFVHPRWAERRPGWRARWPHRGPVGLPFYVLGSILSALPR